MADSKALTRWIEDAVTSELAKPTGELATSRPASRTPNA